MDKRIQFVKAAVDFGETRLGLEFDGSFKKFVSKFKTANWLYACKPHALESALPGNAPFLFDWDAKKLAAKERSFIKLGLHTYLYMAEAHGGAQCPITPALLDASRARQLYVILHEAWHSTLRLGQVRVPYPLEEATGRVVGVLGAVEFAKAMRDRALIEETENQAVAWGDLAAFVNKYSGVLDRLYVKKTSRAKISAEFRKISDAASALREKTDSPWEKVELTRKMNNAFFLRYRDYTKYYPLALSVCEKYGSVKKAMENYLAAGRKGAIEFLRRISY